MLYHMTFVGRRKGAIGITYLITSTVSAETIDDAWLKLYDEYEHIRLLEWTSHDGEGGANDTDSEDGLR